MSAPMTTIVGVQQLVDHVFDGDRQSAGLVIGFVCVVILLVGRYCYLADQRPLLPPSPRPIETTAPISPGRTSGWFSSKLDKIEHETTLSHATTERLRAETDGLLAQAELLRVQAELKSITTPPAPVRANSAPALSWPEIQGVLRLARLPTEHHQRLTTLFSAAIAEKKS